MPFDGATYTETKSKSTNWWRSSWSGFWRTAPVPVVPMHIQILRVARDAIAARRNWIQGKYETDGGRRCAVGAMRYAVRALNADRGYHQQAHRILLAVVRRGGFHNIETMNDRSTHATVIQAFDQAIGSACISVRRP